MAGDWSFFRENAQKESHMQPVQSFRRLFLKATLAPLLILGFLPTSQSFAQSCSIPAGVGATLAAVEGSAISDAPNCGAAPAACGTIWTTPAAMQAGVTARLQAFVPQEFPSCSISVAPSSPATSVPMTWIASYSNCPALNPATGSGAFQITDGYFRQWACFTPGYVSNNTSGFCPLTNAAMVECSPGVAGFENVTTPISSKADGECPSCKVADPITVATGNVFLKEVDYAGGATDHLTFARYYNSDPAAIPGEFGPAWRGEYDRSIVLTSDSYFQNSGYTGPPLAMVYRKDGRILTFNVSNSVPVATDSDIVETLARTSTGWTLTNADDTVETYTTVTAAGTSGPTNPGELTQIQFRGGDVLTVNYNAAQQVSSVSDLYGKTLAFAYTSGGRLASMTDPSGNQIAYSYPSASLGSVTYPGSAVRTYTYSNLGLETITDESAVNYDNWTMSTAGVATSNSMGTSSTLSPRPTTYMTSYSTTAPGTSTTVEDNNGRTDVYTFQVINGVPKYTRIVTNGNITRSATYDANGNFTSRTDPKGYTTNYSVDARGLEELKTEAAGTSVARTTATQWHPVFHLPTERSVYAGNSASGTPISVASFTYDSLGNLLTKTFSDPSAGISRTWTYTYDNGGLRVVS